MYEEYGQITNNSMEPNHTKGIHVKILHASQPSARDKKTEKLLNDMTKWHGSDFTIISISNSTTVSGFSTQVTYRIS